MNDASTIALAFSTIVGPAVAWFASQRWQARKDQREEDESNITKRTDERETMQTIIEGFERLRGVESKALEAVRGELREAVENGRFSEDACSRCVGHLDEVLEAWIAMGDVIGKSAEDIRERYLHHSERVRAIGAEREGLLTGPQRQEIARRRAADSLLRKESKE